MTKLDGTAFDLRELRGRWVFVMVDSGDCDPRCEDKLLMMRQQRTMTGKDRDQIERVWLIPDQVPLSIMLMREFEGTHFIRSAAATATGFSCVTRRCGCAATRPYLGRRSAWQSDAALAEEC